MYAIGVMSGTSLDGLDIVIIDLHAFEQQRTIQVVASTIVQYEAEFQQALYEICHNETATLAKITMLNAYIGQFIGEKVKTFIQEKHINKDKIAFISSHGQTIFHEPIGGEGRYDMKATLQIGDLSYISEVSQLPVVGDFRTGDMAAGGQGAPLLSYFDAVFLKSEKYNRAIQNIGGIGNVTYVPKDGTVLSFDTGPGNVLIDGAIKHLTNGALTYDRNGEIARKGAIHHSLIKKWMQHRYYHDPLPKTTGRELYTAQYLASLLNAMTQYSVEDQLATLTAYTVETIAHSYKTYLPFEQLDEIYVNGGGSLNTFMMELLQGAMPNQIVQSLNVLGVPSDLKEAIAFALLGYNTMCGTQNQIPSATGAAREVVMGKVAYCNGNPWARFEQLRGY